MPNTRRRAMELAALATTYPAGYCARWVRTMFGIASSGDADGDGDVDAVDAWHRAVGKHPGDRNPPDGVPVFWSGGRKGFGHIAMSWPGDRIRGTDSPSTGRVGTVAFDWPERMWGLKYVGWAEGLSGVRIPDDTPRLPQLPKRIQRYLDETKVELGRLKAARAAAIARGEKPEPYTVAIKNLRASRRQAKEIRR